MERYELPDGWEWSTLGECCLVNDRDPALKKLPNDSTVSFVPMAAVDAEQGVIANPVDRPFSEVRKGFTPFSDGDVIFAKITPSMENGKAAIARGLTNGFGFGSTEFHVMRPKESVIAEWVFHFIRQQSFRDEAKGSFTGTAGQLRVPEKFILNADIPLAPVPEQQRIVAKIESLFEQSRTARAALTRIPALISQFRRAVLASAFRGELVEPDPSDEPAESLLERVREARLSNAAKKLAHSETVNTDSLPAIPETWTWTTLEMLADIRNGVTKGRDLSKFEIIEIPYLRVANVQDGYLDLKEMKTIQVKKTELERVRLRPNDILFNEGGDRDKLGRGTVWHGEIDVCTHQNHVHCARLYLQDVIPDWVSLASQLSYARDYFFSAASQTVNLASLNSTQLKGLPVPLAPGNEQRRILEKVKALFAQADIIEQAASVSLRRAEQVDQSILARAFRGELG